MQNFRIKYLDGIRILSSIVVCISHAIEVFIMPKLGIHHWLIFSFKYAASTSVVIFFILSGFMVTNSILNNKKRNGEFKFNAYCQDRLFRLYPPLIFSVMLSFLIYKTILIFGMNGSTTFRLPNELNLSRDAVYFSYHELAYSLFFVQGFIDTTMWLNGPLWSLGEEFVLYIIASFVAIGLLNRKFIVPVMMLFLLGFVLYYTGHWKNCLYLYSLWGLGAAFSIENSTKRPFLGKGLQTLLAVFSLLVFVIVLKNKNFYLPEVTYEVSSFAVLQSSFILFVILLFRVAPQIYQNFLIKGLELITPEKDFTYTLYVIHFPILIFVFSCVHFWTYTHSIAAIFFPWLFLVVAIIYLSKYLATLLENKKLVKRAYDFILNH